MLLQLLREHNREVFDSQVVSLSQGGSIGSELVRLGIPVHELAPSRNSFSGPLKIPRIVLRFQPDVIQTWMYQADLFGSLSARLVTRAPIVWGIHSGPPPPEGFNRRRRIGMGLLARLSYRLPTRIVCCSETSRSVHVAAGYSESKMVVVPNGFVVPETTPGGKREALLKELGLPSDVLLVGRIGRDHPQKDVGTLLESFRRIRDSRVHLVIAGRGLSRENPNLLRRLRTSSSERVHLLGLRSDVLALNAAFDVAVSSSSFGEGLPLVLGEAMALGTPVVSTDVGDAIQLIGDQERVVPPRDPEALAAAVLRVLRMPERTRKELGRRDRDRVLAQFSLKAMVSKYEDVYREVLLDTVRSS